MNEDIEKVSGIYVNSYVNYFSFIIFPFSKILLTTTRTILTARRLDPTAARLTELDDRIMLETIKYVNIIIYIIKIFQIFLCM